MVELSKSLKKINAFTGGLHDKLNPDFPDLVLLTQNGKDPEKDYRLRDKMYQEGRFRIYIGKMLKKGENIYSRIVLENYVGELLKNCWRKNESFTIELCKSVGDVLNDDDQKENTMSAKEQKDFLTDMIKKSYGANAVKKVHIICLDEQPEQQELLNLIKDKGLKGLHSSQQPALPVDRERSDQKIQSIDIAKYLYRVCNTNDEFMKMIYETKSESLRSKEGNKFDRLRSSDFYGMIEIAIRLTDFLNGIMVQGGVRRQEKYDKIIRFLLDYNYLKELDSFQRKFSSGNFKQEYEPLPFIRQELSEEEIKAKQEKKEERKREQQLQLEKIKNRHRKIPELNPFQDWLQKNKQWKTQPFYSHHFDTSPDDNQDLKEKKLEQKKVKNKLNIIKYVTMAAIVATLGSAKLYDSHKKKEIQEMTLQTMESIFKDKRISDRSGQGPYSEEFKGEEAAEFIKKDYVDRLVMLYKIRYAKYEDIKISEDELRLKIISCLNNQKVLSTLGHSELRSMNLNIVLDQIIIPQYIGEFIANKMETLPYQKYAEYEDGFINILDADSSLFEDPIIPSVASNNKYNISGNNAPLDSYKKSKLYRIQPVGDFALFDQNDIHGTNLYGNGCVYSLGLKTRYDASGENEIPYIVAKGPVQIGEYKCEDSKQAKPNLRDSKRIAINYFLQTKPVITEILNEYIVRYKHFEGPTSQYRYLPNQDMPIRNVTLWDDVIETFVRDVVKHKIYDDIKVGEADKIIAYVDKVVASNKQTFIDSRENVVPYGFYKNLIPIFQRTLQKGDKIQDSRINNPGTSNKYQTTDIGYYRVSDGEYYHMIAVKVNGQEYIYASHVSNPSYEGQENSFGINHGIEVAKDFMKHHYSSLKTQ